MLYCIAVRDDLSRFRRAQINFNFRPVRLFHLNEKSVVDKSVANNVHSKSLDPAGWNPTHYSRFIPTSEGLCILG
jgi:hypothetical protein